MAKQRSQRAIEKEQAYMRHLDRIHQIREYRQKIWGQTYDPLKSDVFDVPTVNQGDDYPDNKNTDNKDYQSTYDNSSNLSYTVTSSGFVVPDNIKLATIKNGTVRIPSREEYGGRSPYHNARINAAKNSNYKGFVSVDTDKFWFVNGEHLQNKFAPDFAEILYLMRDALEYAGFVKKDQKIQVNSGFRSKAIDGVRGAHMNGTAVDIGVNLNNRYLLADTCWALGLRAIAVAKTFVHIDCAPQGSWAYSGTPKYIGPDGPKG